jgi:hypothetical protein
MPRILRIFSNLFLAASFASGPRWFINFGYMRLTKPRRELASGSSMVGWKFGAVTKR